MDQTYMMGVTNNALWALGEVATTCIDKKAANSQQLASALQPYLL